MPNLRFPHSSNRAAILAAGYWLCLCAGCGVVLPSVRTGMPTDAAICSDCDGGANSGESLADDPGAANTGVRPPHSKFHPVPTRPVFAPLPEQVAAAELEPIPAAEEPQPFDPPQVDDELPAPEEELKSATPARQSLFQRTSAEIHFLP